MTAFQFPADVWGTVSDWIMIGVTTTTAIFLYRTLRSQREVQQAQNKLLKIEQLRLRQQFKPILQYSRFEHNRIINEPGKKVVSFAIKNISDNTAYNLSPKYTPSNSDKYPPLSIEPIPRNLKSGNFIGLDYKADLLNDNTLEYEIIFYVQFEDVAGTKYHQTVTCEAYRGGENIKDEEPYILDLIF